MNSKPSTINNKRARLAAAGLSLVGCEPTCAPSNTGNGDGTFIRIRNPEHRAKAQLFWENLAAKRKLPGHCARCGREHGGAFRQCDPCRKKVAELKAKRQSRGLDLAKCIVMVLQCRREVTKLREMFKNSQRMNRKLYARGYNKGRKNGLTLAKYHDAYPTISKQELATMNHAYEAED